MPLEADLLKAWLVDSEPPCELVHLAIANFNIMAILHAPIIANGPNE